MAIDTYHYAALSFNRPCIFNHQPVTRLESFECPPCMLAYTRVDSKYEKKKLTISRRNCSAYMPDMCLIFTALNCEKSVF